MKRKHYNLAFGNASRARILNLIHRNTEMCLPDMEQVLDYTQIKTSRHLIYFKNAGLVSFRKHGQWVSYFSKVRIYKVQTADFTGQILDYPKKGPVLVKDQKMYQILHSNRALAVCKLHGRKWITHLEGTMCCPSGFIPCHRPLPLAFDQFPDLTAISPSAEPLIFQ